MAEADKVCLFLKSVREGAENGVDQAKVWFETFLGFMYCGAHLLTNWFSTSQHFKGMEFILTFKLGTQMYIKNETYRCLKLKSKTFCNFPAFWQIFA